MEFRLPRSGVSAHRDSALGGEREEGPLQTERPSLYSCLCHKDKLQNLCKALMCEMGVFMLALTTPWNVCENLHLTVYKVRSPALSCSLTL